MSLREPPGTISLIQIRQPIRLRVLTKLQSPEEGSSDSNSDDLHWSGPEKLKNSMTKALALCNVIITKIYLLSEPDKAR